MMWLKSCPRCSGDLYKRKDVYGDYIACIQCGHYLGESEQARLLGQDPPVAEPVANPKPERGGNPLQFPKSRKTSYRRDNRYFHRTNTSSKTNSSE